MSNLIDDYITSSEALKRLGQNAPANSTFYNAVSVGKITKAPATKADANGPNLVSWSSVQEWNNHRITRKDGHRQQPQVRKPARDRVAPAASAAAALSAKEIPPLPVESSWSPEAAAPADISFSPAAPTPAAMSVYQDHDQQTTSKPPPLSKPAKHPGKRTASSAPSVSTPEARASSKRRTIPLRKFKAMLRHLPFEQSLDLRNWLDNRLLYKLKPETPALNGAPPQPARDAKPEPQEANNPK